MSGESVSRGRGLAGIECVEKPRSDLAFRDFHWERLQKQLLPFNAHQKRLTIYKF